MTAPQGQIPKSENTTGVLTFKKLFNLNDDAIFLNYHDVGFGADWCHISAKHQAITHGGKRVHGWALWQFEEIMLADFHSVWFDGEKLVDVTPPKFEETKVLFVPDQNSDIYKVESTFVLPTNRSSLIEAPYWWMGEKTDEPIWGLPETTPAFQEYCMGLGFSPDKIITDQVAG